MTPLPAGALQSLHQTLPPERQDPCPHLANLSPDDFLCGWARITQIAKQLKEERQAREEILLETFTGAELRLGVCAPGGWVLRQRNGTSWDDAPEVRDAIKSLQQQAQQDGREQPLKSTYPCLTKDSACDLQPSIRPQRPVGDE
jgi:hypothetical protein